MKEVWSKNGDALNLFRWFDTEDGFFFFYKFGLLNAEFNKLSDHTNFRSQDSISEDL